MAFKLKSGNKASFKDICVSPIKFIQNTAGMEDAAERIQAKPVVEEDEEEVQTKKKSKPTLLQGVFRGLGASTK
jgi:hypothetical protein